MTFELELGVCPHEDDQEQFPDYLMILLKGGLDDRA